MKKEEMRRGTDTQMIIVLLISMIDFWYLIKFDTKKLVHLMNKLEKIEIK